MELCGGIAALAAVAVRKRSMRRDPVFCVYPDCCQNKKLFRKQRRPCLDTTHARDTLWGLGARQAGHGALAGSTPVLMFRLGWRPSQLASRRLV